VARIRSIHPDACKSEKLAACSSEAERCYWRLQTHCDDEGRCEDHSRLIWAALFPLHESVTPADVDLWLKELHVIGLVERYEVGGSGYLEVVQWDVYQHPNRPTPSKLPESRARTHGGCSDDAMSHPGGLTPGEGEGGEKERARATVEDQFEEAWAPYPKKLARKAALKAYTARRREGATRQELVTASANYAAVVRRDRTEDRFILHGATFFGPNERWRDYLTITAPVSPLDATDAMSRRKP
jgi:hypothetical protein